MYFSEGNTVVICHTFVDSLYIYMSYAHCILHGGSSFIWGFYKFATVLNEFTVPTALKLVFRFSGVAVLHTTMFLLTCENKFPIK